MPLQEDNERMVELENAIMAMVTPKKLQHAYSRTGNSLKEFVFYAKNTDQFLEDLNQKLADSPRYPIEIDFYEDKEWEDFQKILDSVKE